MIKIDLTKQERNEVYKKAKARIESRLSRFMCPALLASLVEMGFIEKYNSYLHNIDFNQTFPEFMKRKPRNFYDTLVNYWFHPDEVGKRIDILNSCIKETEETNKKWCNPWVLLKELGKKVVLVARL